MQGPSFLPCGFKTKLELLDHTFPLFLGGNHIGTKKLTFKRVFPFCGIAWLPYAHFALFPHDSFLHFELFSNSLVSPLPPVRPSLLPPANNKTKFNRLFYIWDLNLLNLLPPPPLLLQLCPSSASSVILLLFFLQLRIHQSVNHLVHDAATLEKEKNVHRGNSHKYINFATFVSKLIFFKPYVSVPLLLLSGRGRQDGPPSPIPHLWHFVLSSRGRSIISRWGPWGRRRQRHHQRNRQHYVHLHLVGRVFPSRRRSVGAGEGAAGLTREVEKDLRTKRVGGGAGWHRGFP